MSDNKPDNIWRLQAQFDIQGLVQALKDPSPAIRKRAAAALRTIHATQAVPMLKAVLRVESDPDTRVSILSAIESLDAQTDTLKDPSSNTPATPQVTTPDSPLKQLMEQLKDPNSQVVVAAAQKLGELGDKNAVVALILQFNDLNSPIQVRLAMAEALIKLESAPVEVALLANLRHPEWHIRRNGAAILGQLKAEWAIEPLGKALGDPHPTVRKTALAALKYIGTPEARKTLARYATGLLPRPQTSPLPSSPPQSDAPKSRLLDKSAPKDPSASLPKGLEVKKASEPKAKPSDDSTHNMTTDMLDTSVLDEYEKRQKPNSDPSS